MDYGGWRLWRMVFGFAVSRSWHLLPLVLFAASRLKTIQAQTEGDTGYDYNYDDEFYDESALSKGPTFDVPMTNVTVVIGQTAVLPCSIDYLGKHKVAWLDYNSFPVTYEDRRVIDDSRFSIIRPQDKEWNLQLHEVKAEDDGAYRCTINTMPVRSKVVMLRVSVPPEIVDNASSHDVTVQEGDVVALVCVADGRPKPEITWYRRENLDKCYSETAAAAPSSSSAGAIIAKGERFVVGNMTRRCGGRFECEANNGIPPSVRRKMTVTVEFPPRIQMPNRRLGQVKGRRETILNCVITAFPHATNYWTKDGRRISSSLKHHIEAYDEGNDALTLSLRIHDLTQADYGTYKCVAANALGRDEGAVLLFETEPNHGRTSDGGGGRGGGGGGRGGGGGLQRNVVKVKSTSSSAAASNMEERLADDNTPAIGRFPAKEPTVLLEAIRITGDIRRSRKSTASIQTGNRSKYITITVLSLRLLIKLCYY